MTLFPPCSNSHFLPQSVNSHAKERFQPWYWDSNTGPAFHWGTICFLGVHVVRWRPQPLDYPDQPGELYALDGPDAGPGDLLPGRWREHPPHQCPSWTAVPSQELGSALAQPLPAVWRHQTDSDILRPDCWGLLHCQGQAAGGGDLVGTNDTFTTMP